MAFIPKPTRNKTNASYKTVYMSQTLNDAITAIAKENNTSFNNVVVSMIEHCLAENEDESEQ